MDAVRKEERQHCESDDQLLRVYGRQGDDRGETALFAALQEKALLSVPCFDTLRECCMGDDD